MSATFKIAKKKYTQHDLRRLMQEQKLKAKQSTSEQKVDSPLAKYNDAGQLTCIICKSVIRSASVWKVHINTKQHRENLLAAKELRSGLQSSTSEPTKRAGETLVHNLPDKKAKVGISEETKTKEVSKSEQESIPSDFFNASSSNRYFDVTLRKTSIKKDLVNIKRGTVNDENDTIPEHTEMDVDKTKTLPEGFFDDPIKDAKIRHLEYKNPQEEEWERFQREIKEESTLSNAIIAEEREEATTERQLKEIDEQMLRWERVLDLEKRKELVFNIIKEQRCKVNYDDEDSNSSGIEDFDEYMNWRSKT